MTDKQQLAAMGEHMAGQGQAMCMSKRIEELEEQVLAMCRTLNEYRECTAANVCLESLLASIDAALAGQGMEQHSDDAAVDRFAIAMKAKLAEARSKGRGGWDDPNACTLETLAALLLGHIGKGNRGNWEDIANLAMMLHQRGADPALLSGHVLPIPAVPEGWQLVPKTPTLEMLDQGLNMLNTWGFNTPEEIYCAMLAAAPNPGAK